MEDSGDWWYDRHYATGATIDPSVNADMISAAFWRVKGREFKITRSDDSSHTALLQTKGNELKISFLCQLLQMNDSRSWYMYHETDIFNGSILKPGRHVGVEETLLSQFL